jgi:hypothetical protein
VAKNKPTLLKFLEDTNLLHAETQLQPYQKALLNSDFTVKKYILAVRPRAQQCIKAFSARIGQITTAHVSANTLDLIQEVKIINNKNEG